jgi:hypothetical protein
VLARRLIVWLPRNVADADIPPGRTISPSGLDGHQDLLLLERPDVPLNGSPVHAHLPSDESDAGPDLGLSLAGMLRVGEQGVA